jgi:hypothetical protein
VRPEDGFALGLVAMAVGAFALPAALFAGRRVYCEVTGFFFGWRRGAL